MLSFVLSSFYLVVFRGAHSSQGLAMGTHRMLCSMSCQSLLWLHLCSHVNMLLINEAFVLSQETIEEYTLHFNDWFMIHCFYMPFSYLRTLKLWPFPWTVPKHLNTGTCYDPVISRDWTNKVIDFLEKNIHSPLGLKITLNNNNNNVKKQLLSKLVTHYIFLMFPLNIHI